MRFHSKETIVGDKFDDGTYEYRTVTLCEMDYSKLPREYRQYYLADNQDRIRTQQEYLAEQDRLMEQ